MSQFFSVYGMSMAMMLEKDHPETHQALVSIEAYSDDEKIRCCAEAYYYLMFGELPDWAILIEQVEVVDGNLLFHAVGDRSG